jgi:hypothetical protein
MIVPVTRADPDKEAEEADDGPGPVTDIIRPCVMLFPRSRSLSLSLSGGCKLDITGGWAASGRVAQR